MSRYQLPAGRPLAPVVIQQFRGVDFSSDSTQVDVSRSPDALNMIADQAFFPVKRTGYKRVAQGSGRVWGLHRLAGGGGEQLLAHIGTALYRVGADGGLTQLCTGMAAGRSRSFVMGDCLYLLDGVTYRRYDGAAVRPVAEVAYLPTVRIGAPPAGGGKTFEAVNLLTPGRKESFQADGSATAFQLSTGGLDGAAVTAVVAGAAKAEGTDFTVDRAAGRVTFKTAPPKAVQNVDNVVITYRKTVAGHRQKIDGCRLFGIYGGKNDTRVFLAGNAAEKNVDWQSGLYDPTYFPDTGYTKVGGDASAIMGYARQYETQIILKEDNDQDATQFLRTFELDGEGSPLFPLQQGAAGAGAVSSDSFQVLEDAPLFLSPDGVYGVAGTAVTQQRMLRHCSRRIDNRLLGEPGLAEAAACVFQGRYYLAVNGHCYLADSRQVYRDGGSAQYEWYYWDNIPAVCWCALGESLYFGTADGRVCRFCRPEEEGAYRDDGAPIEAYWVTPYLHFGTWTRYKTVRDVHVAPLPYQRSGIEVYYSSDEEGERLVAQENIDLFDWERMDFGRFSFRTIQVPSVLATGVKERKIQLFQLKLRNAQLDEPFGFVSISITYGVGGKVK
ncbi:hypothetical protein [Bittarella massiliensis (ex Durand et al. 2017)]|uniref:hypothetical protein n=1 Tax=Bittarella massiliensis (ex Durand et al. 2017) TaxID=1720313 RepID=UPI00073EE7EE|nr:hypothetical protein [Bittarella massiliensis (ex Durand et al. 2017)]